jgi:hypothetical protein
MKIKEPMASKDKIKRDTSERKRGPIKIILKSAYLYP